MSWQIPNHPHFSAPVARLHSVSSLAACSPARTGTTTAQRRSAHAGWSCRTGIICSCIKVCEGPIRACRPCAARRVSKGCGVRFAARAGDKLDAGQSHGLPHMEVQVRKLGKSTASACRQESSSPSSPAKRLRVLAFVPPTGFPNLSIVDSTQADSAPFPIRLFIATFRQGFHHT